MRLISCAVNVVNAVSASLFSHMQVIDFLMLKLFLSQPYNAKSMLVPPFITCFIYVITF